MKKLQTTKIENLEKILNKYGVAILNDYFDEEYADNLFDSAKAWMINLNVGLSNDSETWKLNNTPLGPRFGMYQSIISHFPQFWKLREDMYYVFAYLYGKDELLTSIDGASIYPSRKPRKRKDWPHIDQTVSSDFLCYQSQFVTTDTTASFVATLKSHSFHKKILNNFGIVDNKTNWHKFSDDQIVELQKIFDKKYQTPIYAKKGSIIFWDSRTIHSAKYQDANDNSWRGVFYVSMRPIENFSKRNINVISKAAITGRTTNHWGSKMFAVSDRYNNKNEKVTKLLKNLEKINYIDEMNPLQKKLVGLLDWNK